MGRGEWEDGSEKRGVRRREWEEGSGPVGEWGEGVESRDVNDNTTSSIIKLRCQIVLISK